MVVRSASHVVANREPRGPRDAEDGHGDEQADDRIDDLYADRDGSSSGYDGERDVRVGACVVAVSDEGGRLQASSGAGAAIVENPSTPASRAN